MCQQMAQLMRFSYLSHVYMAESSKFENPELKKFKSQNLHHAYKMLTTYSLNGQSSLKKLKANKRCYYNLVN